MEEIRVPFKPFDKQLDIREHTARFRVIACGRRWGKSTFAINEIFRILYKRFKETKKLARGWVVAPTFSLVDEDWQIAKQMFRGFHPAINETKKRIKIWGGVVVEFKSGDQGVDKLLGAGLDALLVDEAARLSGDVWKYALRPALSDKMGKAIFISTPKGRNWFYDIYLMGKNGSDWKSWNFPTNSRPSFPQEEWQTILDTTPERILQQEYMAEFLEDEATVFHNLSSCFRGELEDPQENERYVFGVDLAKTYDWTVITGIKRTSKQVVYFSRHKETDWSLQKKLIKGLNQKFFHPKFLIDSTGVGDPIEEDLRKSGLHISGYKFNNTTKQEMVEALIVAIEQGLIGIPKSLDILINELRAFEYEVLPTGRIRYKAPEGLHDDCVISLGLAVMGIRHNLYTKIKPEKPKEKEGTWDWYHKKIKTFNRLKKLSQNQRFNDEQIWQYVTQNREY